MKTNIKIFILFLLPLTILNAQETKISLEKYCPTKTGQEGALCFAYATTYTALSIEHNVKENNTDEASENFKSFSYGFVASKVKKNKSFIGRLFNRCGRNATAKLALEVLKENGTVSYSEFPEKCECKKTDEMMDKANVNKIKDYHIIEEPNENKYIKKIKNNLLNKKPIITTIYQEDFFGSRSNNGKESITFPGDYTEHDTFANHVVCIVGFDDAKNGGSFLIKNNYKAWGKNGFSYVKYKDFLKLIRTSYIIEI